MREKNKKSRAVLSTLSSLLAINDFYPSRVLRLSAKKRTRSCLAIALLEQRVLSAKHNLNRNQIFNSKTPGLAFFEN